MRPLRTTLAEKSFAAAALPVTVTRFDSVPFALIRITTAVSAIATITIIAVI